ncbi:MAG: adenylate/guanylate cyclase domain-containing protein [Acidimicrobiia bacterium]|nr:adenylate/guanylate cyclase domain-containing protein [Acidimicrobiia bacterium]
MQTEERRLAAIVVGDVVGYSAMIGANEADTLAKVFAFQSQLLKQTIGEHCGRLVKTTGDGFLAEFSSVVSAVRCAIGLQVGLGAWPDVGDPLSLRIGVHLGDVVVRDGDIYGDGVNIAARLEQAADPGGILVSSAIRDQLAGHEVDRFSDAGEMDLKNIDRPIHTWRWAPDSRSERVPTTRPSIRPSIAVLPFDDLSGDPEQGYLADGVVQDLITLLSRFHWFRVIARASTFALAGQNLDATDLGRRLNARYLLQGSVRRAGNRVRLTAELVDSSSGTQVWAERFDRTFDDVFELQDEIVRGIVGTVVPHFVVNSGALDNRTNSSSWELAMRGWNLAWRLDGSEDTMLRARALFEQAIELDPGNGLAYSGLAFTFGNPFYLAGLTR